MDLTNLRIVTHHDAAEAALTLFTETVRDRTGLDLQPQVTGGRASVGGPGVGNSAGAASGPGARSGTTLHLSIAEPATAAVAALDPQGAEGYRIAAAGDVEVCGSDARGLLYGVGKLLRCLALRPGSIGLPEAPSVASTPAFPLRGHQLGYRPKTNAYDAWTKEQYRRYIMDLAIFGANSIEIMPPRTDDEATSPVMKYDALEMMAWLSKTIHSFGMDVWVWYPNMGDDYADPVVREAERAERVQVFEACPSIDHIFVPGGDPGDLEPDALFSWTGEVAEVLRRRHPEADIWLSPQAFRLTQEWLQSFYRNVETLPDWLGGVVYGPWERDDLPTLRRRVPDVLPIRRYPDITHSLGCQYPVRGWDTTFAVTLGRECYNPRPRAFKAIHNRLSTYACGSLSYSEGINDDVNKLVWSDQDWDPETPVEDTLRDLGRLFVGPDAADEMAECLLALEEHWIGPIEANERIPRTLSRLRRLEADHPEPGGDYRLAMAAFRAHYDAYQQLRRTESLGVERRVRLILSDGGSAPLERVTRALDELERNGRAVPPAERASLRDSCVERADALFELIGWQTSVDRHGGQAVGRGAFLDAIDAPLGDAPFLQDRLRALAGSGGSVAEVGAAIDSLLGVPAVGGRTIDLEPASAPALVDRYERPEDPAHHHGALVSFAAPASYNRPAEWQGLRPLPALGLQTDPAANSAAASSAAGDRWSDISHVRTYYDSPLTITVRGLRRSTPYRLTVSYAGSNWGTRCSLRAGEATIATDLEIPRGISTVTHQIPPESVSPTGDVTLRWTADDGYHGPGVARMSIEPEA